ncbi:MAG: ribosome maturation factor RimP [Actinobacteria bacterium]|nr:MAG: ribosome maturation factor RimP [Actinomycetota bacterium]
MLEAQAAGHELELVAVEVVGATRNPTVRVYLDREGGIDLDAITGANRWISTTVEESGLIGGAFTLEVSSPGIERPLAKPSDFAAHVGERAKVRTSAPVGGRSNFTGTIASADGDAVVIDTDGTTHRVPFAVIARAHLKVDIEF